MLLFFFLSGVSFSAKEFSLTVTILQCARDRAVGQRPELGVSALNDSGHREDLRDEEPSESEVTDGQ